MDNVLWPLNMTTKCFKSVTFYHPVGSAKMFTTVLLLAIMLQDKELGLKCLITDSLCIEASFKRESRCVLESIYPWPLLEMS